MMHTILITADPDIAADAETAGVSRIMVDLEIIGKKERQASRTTFISSHSMQDISKVRSVLTKAELMVRINPWHAGSPDEIRQAIASGADMIMLPMINDLADIEAVLRVLPETVPLVPLVETAYSMQHLADISAMKRVKEVYIGLNDLHLSLGMEFLFEPLASGVLDEMASVLQQSGKSFGFGGIAMMGSGELPAERILGEHERLGSTRVILSSRFCKDIQISEPNGRISRIKSALSAMQNEYERLQQRNTGQRSHDFDATAAIIMHIAKELKIKRQVQ